MTTENQSEPDIAAMKEYISTQVRAGFQKPEEIIDQAIDYIEGEPKNPQLQILAKKILTEEQATLQEEQKSWPKITDCDRLDQAFAELEKEHILARQDFSCCGNCGVSEIWNEMVQLKKQGLPVKGYTFYHSQDTQSAVEGRGLFLNYGSIVEKNEQETITIGHQIVDVLKKQGLSPQWNGKTNSRIFVPIDWKKRV